MVAKEEEAQFIILKFPQIPISILCHCNDDTDKVVCTYTYRHIYILHITYLYYLDFFYFVIQMLWHYLKDSTIQFWNRKF